MSYSKVQSNEFTLSFDNNYTQVSLGFFQFFQFLGVL